MDKSLLVRGGRIVDPSQGLDVVGDVLVSDGAVAWCAPAGHGRSVPVGCPVLDAQGLVVSPGFIDLHCHLREPGFEDKETVATGALAAVRGGFTTLCVMPNTEPPVDSAAVVQFLLRRAQDVGLARLLPIGCITRGRRGAGLVEMAEMADAGAVAFSDDGDPVEDPYIMRMALTYAAPLGLPVIEHCEERSLTRNAEAHEGWVASRLGLTGMPAQAEESMAARDIELAALTGGRLHLAHISTAGTLELVRRARERGLPVTAEVTPHHLLLTEEWLLGAPEAGNGRWQPPAPYAPLTARAYDTAAKVNPPLRTVADAAALVRGLRAGEIDAIATDHAPHNLVDKVCTFSEAAFGISILETALGMLLALVHRGDLDLSTVVERLTVGPARVLGPRCAHLGSLAAGAAGDVTLFDPDAEWTVDTARFASRGRNTPLAGMTLRGKVVATVVGGRVVHGGEESRLPGAGAAAGKGAQA